MGSGNMPKLLLFLTVRRLNQEHPAPYPVWTSGPAVLVSAWHIPLSFSGISCLFSVLQTQWKHSVFKMPVRRPYGAFSQCFRCFEAENSYVLVSGSRTPPGGLKVNRSIDRMT
jgi:hypothetical protein